MTKPPFPTSRLPLLPSLLLLLLLHQQPTPTHTHSFLSMPTPITRTTACRISSGPFGAHCPGPCPNTHIRYDSTPQNPSAIYRRNGLYEFRWTRNNHEGGFIRWSLVPLSQKDDRSAHEGAAFYWQCWDTGRRRCAKSEWHRHCYYDDRNTYFSNYIRIPTHLPDNDYVLSFAWYGGGGTWGDFGDYYDCAYVRIKGGPLTSSWRPRMRSGKGSVGKDGKCLATVNRLGVCYKEPCPGGGSFSKMLRPKEFEDGKQPQKLLRRWFGDHKVWPRYDFGIRSLKIVRVKDLYVLAESRSRKKVVMNVRRSHDITVLADVFGDVKAVTFYNNGRQARRTTGPKIFSIAGDWHGKNYAPWRFLFDKKWTTISAKAEGKYGGETWVNIDLVSL